MGRKNLGEEIFNDLEHQILSGTYHIGDRLPPERELAEQYLVSRVPIRGALKRLAEHGYIETTGGSGSVVVSQGNPVLEQEPVLLKSPPNISDMRFLLETIRLRRTIEGQAARMAAANRTPEDLKAIQNGLFESINEIRKLKLRENNHFFEADLRFHKAVITASHDDFLIGLYEQMPLIITGHQYWSLKFTPARDEVVSYHTRIYESILDEDEDEAYDAMCAHLSRVEEHLHHKDDPQMP